MPRAAIPKRGTILHFMLLGDQCQAGMGEIASSALALCSRRVSALIYFEFILSATRRLLKSCTPRMASTFSVVTHCKPLNTIL